MSVPSVFEEQHSFYISCRIDGYKLCVTHKSFWIFDKSEVDIVEIERHPQTPISMKEGMGAMEQLIEYFLEEYRSKEDEDSH